MDKSAEYLAEFMKINSFFGSQISAARSGIIHMGPLQVIENRFSKKVFRGCPQSHLLRDGEVPLVDLKQMYSTIMG